MGQLHCRHEPAGQKAPSEQLLHDVALSSAENSPAAHGSHSTAPGLEKPPALHASGVAVPGCGQQLPALHGEHVASLEAPMVGE